MEKPNAKQGTVLGPILSSASIAECCREQKSGGPTIGTVVIRSLAFVDDLAGLNHSIRDVHGSHKVLKLFSRKKRIPLNEEKCIIVPINVSNREALPILVVNGREMDICRNAKYLGDVFNSKGDNTDLIEDRVKKGLQCMISSISLASEITFGIHLIKTQISMYKVMFLQVMIFNSGAWNNITDAQLLKLSTVQHKFLKRILHAPSSTTNCFTLLELGILPIKYNIQMSQLNFLHHILTLDAEDPVYLSYNQQKLFEFEKNWYNEVMQLRSKYGLTQTDDEIGKMSEEKWKAVVRKQVFKEALDYLNHENSLKSRTSHHPARTDMRTQDYFLYLYPADARLLFSIRCGTLDLKTLRKYNYEDGDVLCRLCQRGNETVEHIVNHCEEIERTVSVPDVFSLIREDIEAVLNRVKIFVKLVREREEMEEENEL